LEHQRYGKLARVRQLKELIQSTQADIVGLQETIKHDFTNSELEAIAPGGSFYWNWLAATGHSGGILLGVKNDLLEIENLEVDDFFVGVTVRHRKLNFIWDFVNVYGPANHDISPDFIQSLSRRCEKAILPLVLGGDFNLIRTIEDKSTKTGNDRLMKLFNDFIENFELRDLYRGGGKFTWTNKQTKTHSE